jgi:hypothetical protein
MRRVSVVLAVGLLAACKPASDGEASREAAGPVDNDTTIACALNGAKTFDTVCQVERVAGQDGLINVIVRHPDGAFRRFDVLDDGRGLAVADGAQQAISRIEGDKFELAVDRDRYRFPFSLKVDEQ